MPDITIPNTFTDGTTTNATLVAENFYAPNAATPDSLEVINGQLTDANRETSPAWDIEKEMIRPGALSGGEAVGSTMALDFFGSASEEGDYPSSGFVHGEWNNTTNDEAELYRPIPGGSVQFYLPYTPSIFIAHWQVMISHTGNDDTAGVPPLEYTLLKLFVDGVPGTNQVRTIYPAGTSYSRYGKEGDRTWCGHHYDAGSGMTKGWHSLSLRIATATSIARVHCKSISFVYFK